MGLLSRLLMALPLVVLIAASGPAFYAYGSVGSDLVLVDERMCSVELNAMPVYSLGGDYTLVYFVSKPVVYEASVVLEDPEAGLGLVELSITFVPSPDIGVDSEPRVFSLELSESAAGDYRVYYVSASVEVPAESVFIAPVYWVAGSVEVRARDAGDGRFMVTLRLEDLRLDSSYLAPFYIDDPGLPQRVDSVEASYIVDTDGGVFLVDGSELVYVGSRLPFFLYPEAFNVGAIASTVFENLVSWLSEVEEDPGPVLAAAEKIRTADSVEEKSSIANGFADMVFSERILASYTYLGGRCVLDGDSLGAETSCSLGFNFSLPKRILSFSAERFSSLLGSNVTLESLEEALKGAVVMEAIPPGFIHEPVIRLPRLVGVGGLHEPNYEILVPLPSGNPFNASMLYLYSSYGKLYPCGPLEEAGREHALSYLERRRGVSSLEGYTVKILSDNTIEIVEESTGRSTEIRVPTDLNGTDGARYLGDEAIARLQRLAENAWAASGPLLEDYMSRAYEVVLNLVTVTAARGFDEALSEARSRVDMLAREYSQLLELARSWPNISVVTGTPAAPGGDGVESGVVGVANVTEAEAPQEGLVTGAPVLGGEAQGSRAILYLLLLVPVAGSVVLLLLMLRRRW